MKTIFAICASAFATLGLAQTSIPVHLDPSSDSPQIGSLESSGELLPASWPEGVDSRQGWQPVRFQGGFEVYVDNSDIGKDLSPIPGSLYYLEPSSDAPKLGVATEKDRTDIISVDTRFCKMRLETSLIGYAPVSAIQAGITARPPEATHTEAGVENAADEGEIQRELQGLLGRTGLLVRNRTGLRHKLSDPQGQTLALLDFSQLDERVSPEDLLNQLVTVSGSLRPVEGSSALVLVARSVKKAN